MYLEECVDKYFGKIENQLKNYFKEICNKIKKVGIKDMPVIIQ